jgi:hypothetical protein
MTYRVASWVGENFWSKHSGNVAGAVHASYARGSRHRLGSRVQAPHLLIEQIVCLMNETDRDVRDDLGRACFAELLVLSVGHIWISAEPANKLGFPAVLFP